MNKSKPLSEPKQHLKNLVEKEYNTNYVFTTELGRGENMVHRIRVELSRLRRKLIERKQIPKDFKVICVSVEQDKDNNKDTVTLIKTLESDTLTEEMVELMGSMNIGDQIQ